LQRYFGVEAQFWLNLQTEYDLRMMKRKIWTDLERRIIPIESRETGVLFWLQADCHGRYQNCGATDRLFGRRNQPFRHTAAA
jgi:hypothetical protein